MSDDKPAVPATYDWRIGLEKAAWAMGKAALAVSLSAGLDFLANPEHVNQLLKTAGDQPWVPTVALVLVGGFTWLRNWLKQKGVIG